MYSPSLLPAYKVGSDSHGFSKEFSFRTFPLEHWQPNLLIYGDLGVSNAKSMDMLTKDVNTGKYDAIIHMGELCLVLYRVRR